MSALDARNRYIDSLNHIDSAYTKIKGMVGRHGSLTFPDVYKLTEGLFLNGWTYWEAFLRDVFWNDLAIGSGGVLLRDMAIKGRRTNGPYRLAEFVINHPDSPEKFVEWSDYNTVKKRATALLGSGHRFTAAPPQLADIEKLKRIRNAIAHKSDRAWDSFISLAKSPAFLSDRPTNSRSYSRTISLWTHMGRRHRNGSRINNFAASSTGHCPLTIRSSRTRFTGRLYSGVSAMVDDSALPKYCAVMDEVKRRMLVIDFFTAGAGHALFKPTTIESIALQFRKILELIAMASLVANKHAYSTAYADFARHWNAKFLLRDLKKVNPKFYPSPFKELPPTKPGTVKDWEDISVGYLTESDFVKLYDACGGMLHARNPYGSPLKYEDFEDRAHAWYQRIVLLLNCHKVQLVNDDNIYVIHMREDGHDNVRGYVFSPVRA